MSPNVPRVPPRAVGLSTEQQQRWAQRIARHLVAATRTLTRLFLVHSLPESLKVTRGSWGAVGVTGTLGGIGVMGGVGDMGTLGGVVVGGRWGDMRGVVGGIGIMGAVGIMGTLGGVGVMWMLGGIGGT